MTELVGLCFSRNIFSLHYYPFYTKFYKKEECTKLARLAVKYFF